MLIFLFLFDASVNALRAGGWVEAYWPRPTPAAGIQSGWRPGIGFDEVWQFLRDSVLAIKRGLPSKYGRRGHSRAGEMEFPRPIIRNTGAALHPDAPQH